MEKESRKWEIWEACRDSLFESIGETLSDLHGQEDGLAAARRESRGTLVGEVLTRLDHIDLLVPAQVCHEVCPGSVFHTDSGENFFVAIDICFACNGLPFRGLSLSSPVYEAARGKRRGDTFLVGEDRHLIIDLY